MGPRHDWRSPWDDEAANSSLHGVTLSQSRWYDHDQLFDSSCKSICISYEKVSPIFLMDVKIALIPPSNSLKKSWWNTTWWSKWLASKGNFGLASRAVYTVPRKISSNFGMLSRASLMWNNPDQSQNFRPGFELMIILKLVPYLLCRCGLSEALSKFSSPGIPRWWAFSK